MPAAETKVAAVGGGSEQDLGSTVVELEAGLEGPCRSHGMVVATVL